VLYTCIYAYIVSTPKAMAMSNILEKEIESYLVKAVKKKGGFCFKFVSPGISGVPDRIGLFPLGKVVFFELKAPGKQLRPLQEKRKRQLESLGFLVFKIDSKLQVDEIITTIGGDANELHTT